MSHKDFILVVTDPIRSEYTLVLLSAKFGAVITIGTILPKYFSQTEERAARGLTRDYAPVLL